jgi:hypothetical protein
VAIIGDIAHSRVARSNVYLLSKFGAEIVLCGPASLLPHELKQIAPGITLTTDMDEAISDADVIMMLRVQLERQYESAFPAGEYFRFYGLRLEHLKLAKSGCDRDASGADQSRARDFFGGRGLAALGDFESGGKRNRGAHGGPGEGVRCGSTKQCTKPGDVRATTRTSVENDQCCFIKNGRVIDPASGTLTRGGRVD